MYNNRWVDNRNTIIWLNSIFVEIITHVCKERNVCVSGNRKYERRPASARYNLLALLYEVRAILYGAWVHLAISFSPFVPFLRVQFWLFSICANFFFHFVTSRIPLYCLITGLFICCLRLISPRSLVQRNRYWQIFFADCYGSTRKISVLVLQ